MLNWLLGRCIDGAKELLLDIFRLEQAADPLPSHVVWSDIENFLQILFFLFIAQFGIVYGFSLIREILAFLLLIIIIWIWWIITIS